jgi:hypothetical protein
MFQYKDLSTPFLLLGPHETLASALDNSGYICPSIHGSVPHTHSDECGESVVLQFGETVCILWNI